MLNRKFPFNPSFKIHLFIGLVLGALLGFILIVLQPFNVNNFNPPNKNLILAGFGFIKFLNYVVAHLFENMYFKKRKYWTWWNEIIFLIATAISGAFFGYLYLDVVVEKQSLSLIRLLLFFTNIVLPIILLIVFPKMVLRYLLNSTVNEEKEELKAIDTELTEEKITLTGENTKDVLTIFPNQLLYVQSVDNYVKVYFKSGSIESVMLRSKLSAIQKQAPCLVQSHRSYLVNKKQLFQLIGNSQKATLILEDYDIEIPVSRSSYKILKNLFH